MLLTLEVLRRTLALIQERGWTYQYTSDSVGPLNIRSALTMACTELCDDQNWYATYGYAVSVITRFNRDGVMSWEFGTHASKPRRRTQAEVEKVLSAVIDQMEKHEAEVGHGRIPGRSGADAGTAGKRDTGAGPTAL